MFDLTQFGRGNDWLRSFKTMERDFFSCFEGLFASFDNDVIDKEDRYILKTELPGLEKDDISINVENGYLTVRAERKGKEEKKGNGNHLQREHRHFSYLRSFNINDIDEKRIKASYQNGLLTLSMPKRKPTQQPVSRRIEIE